MTIDNEPSTSLKEDRNDTAMVDLVWTKGLKYMPGFLCEKSEKYLIKHGVKTPDSKPAGAFTHKKKGFKSFKAGYPWQFRVKLNVN